MALAISPAVRKELTTLLAQLGAVDSKPRWVSPENLHVTLKFIGEVAREKQLAIEQALASVRVPPPFQLEVANVGFFPNNRRPTVIWLGIQAPSDLAALAAEIDCALAGCGFARETRPFAPHLTLARFKDTRLSAPLQEAIEKVRSRSFGSQPVGEFHLVESKLRSTGAEYTTLRSFPFALQGN